MTRYALAFVLAAAVGAGCAHDEDKPAKTASDAKGVDVPAARPTPTPPAPAPVAEAPQKDDNAIYFDFDSSLVRDDARPVLQKFGDKLKHSSAEKLKVEGNCDEVGTVEYNLALGEARARSAKEYLVHLGVRSNRIEIASYGSQRPKYPGHDDEAHAKNRRDDLVLR